MAATSPKKNRYKYIIFLFLSFFLLSLFFFTKRALNSSLSLSTDLYLSVPHLTPPHNNSHFSASISSSEADPESFNSSSQTPISPISKSEFVLEEFDGTINKTESDDSGVEEKNSENSTAISASKSNSGADPEGLESSPRIPISPISKSEFVLEEFDDTVNKSELVDNGGDVNVDIKRVNRDKQCDLYAGSWVKAEDYPLYQPGSCPYVDEAYDCQSNGRKDSEYLKWRWKPHGCDLPRFNATDFLVRLKGKRLMLVGDSMNRNQFESLLCLLHEGIPDKSRMYETHGYKITKGRGFYIFKFEDYNCTVEFLRSHFLVREGTRLNGQGNSNPTLSIDKIDKTARRWKTADILVFNTGHWWTHGKTARGKKYYKEGDYVYPRFDAVEAYRRALKTWAKWIDENMNAAKKLVFYRGFSSAHFRGGDWDSGGSCNGETEPILHGAFLDNYPLKMKIVEETIQEMKVPVRLLNVTRLTNFRKDGHPSVYGKNRTDGKKISTRRQDCSHWCLPGVPDAWNELIYASLVSQQTTSTPHM